MRTLPTWCALTAQRSDANIRRIPHRYRMASLPTLALRLALAFMAAWVLVSANPAKAIGPCCEGAASCCAAGPWSGGCAECAATVAVLVKSPVRHVPADDMPLSRSDALPANAPPGDVWRPPRLQ